MKYLLRKKINKNKLTIVLTLYMCILTMLVTAFYIVPASSKKDTKKIVEDKVIYKEKDISFSINDEIQNLNKNTIDINSKSYNFEITVLDTDYKISDDLLKKLNNNISSYGAATSFYIISLEDGMSVGYNVDKVFETASSIKAPYALYIYKQIAAGNIDPTQQITYKEKFYNQGTGIIKNSPFGTNYSVEQLVYYSLNESDNIAHEMLHGSFGVSGYNQMLRDLGTKQLYLTSNNPWGFTSARSAALIWQDIYNFALDNNYGVNFLNILSEAKYNYFKEIMPNIPSASKTGFAKYDVVETGIVFDNKPYIAIAIANKGGNRDAYKEVTLLLSYMNDIMTEYNTFVEA